MKHFIIILFVFGLISCKTTEQYGQPKDLDEAISYFVNVWDDIEKEDFKKLPESEAVSELHFSVGMWIRNNWIHGNRDTNLVIYFHKLGIYHPDDISSIILTSLHRKLNNREIDINGQVDYYKAYWKSILECEEKERVRAFDYYNKYKIGNPITIFMVVDTSDGQRNAVLLLCPDVDWTFNPDIDLKISGIVQDKYFINDSSNVFFKVKITKMNFDSTMILMGNVKSGDIKDFSLRGLTIQ